MAFPGRLRDHAAGSEDQLTAFDRLGGPPNFLLDIRRSAREQRVPLVDPTDERFRRLCAGLN